MRSLPYIILYILFLSFCTYSQEFGKVSNEELTMTTLEEFPEADVIILFNKSKIKITPKFELQITNHIRIKILSEAGKEKANIVIPYLKNEEIDEVEALSFLPNGQVFELDEDHIFNEQIILVKQIKFAIPGVEVGSVIEYKYELISKDLFNLKPWYFQSPNFTKVSEVSVYIPTGFKYATIQNNGTKIDLSKSQKKLYDSDSIGRRVVKHTWTGKNIKPLKEEPYMNAFEDYYASLVFQLVSFQSAFMKISFLKPWSDISKFYAPYYDSLTVAEGEHMDFLGDVTKDKRKPLDKVKSIFAYVRSEIETKENNLWIPIKKPEEVYKEKNGSPSEKNTLLLSMLKKAGFKAQPLLISTKENGTIFTSLPQINQFNRTIVYLTIKNKIYFLDTSNKFCSFGYLTPNTKVEMGLHIKKSKGELIYLNPLKPKNRTEIETAATFESDGTVAAISKIKYKGFRALEERSDIFENEKLQDYILEKVNNFNVNVEIDTFYYTDIDSLDKPLSLTIKYKLPNYLEGSEDLLFFTPPFIEKITKNPFEKETRKFPVDFSYNHDIRETINLTFPKTYEVTEKPKTKKSILKRFTFSKLFFVSENKLECIRNYTRKRTFFPVEEYPELRNAYQKIVNSDKDIVVLEKIKN